MDLNLSCNNIGTVSVCLFLLSQKHFGKLSPPEETGNLVPRAFPRVEGAERGYCLPVAEYLICRVRVRKKGSVCDNCV